MPLSQPASPSNTAKTKTPIRKAQKDIFYNVSSGTGPNDLTDEIKLLFLIKKNFVIIYVQANFVKNQKKILN